MPLIDAETAARCSAWPAVLCYAAVIMLRLSRSDARRDALICGLWTVGWVALVVHVSLAMWLFHGGSWAAAYEHTAQRTNAAVGWNWGGGVWLNLITAIIWGMDVLWTWTRPTGSMRGSVWDWVCQFYLAFMIFNATVVFGSLPAQLVGILYCVVLGFMVMKKSKTRAVA